MLTQAIMRREATNLGAVVAGPCQGHRLVAGGTDLADPSVFNAPACVLRRFSANGDASLAARRVRICSSVASSGVPRMVPSLNSKWPQSGSCRSLGFAPVRVPLRWTGYTTYLISGCSTVPAMGTLCGPERAVTPLFSQRDQAHCGQTYSHAAGSTIRCRTICVRPDKEWRSGPDPAVSKK